MVDKQHKEWKFRVSPRRSQQRNMAKGQVLALYLLWSVDFTLNSKQTLRFDAAADRSKLLHSFPAY
jgi:hypothetical protein